MDFSVPRGIEPTLISPTNSSDSVASLGTSPPSSTSEDVVMITDESYFVDSFYSPLSPTSEEAPTFPITALCYPPNGTLNPTPWYAMLPQTYDPKVPPALAKRPFRSRSQSYPMSKQKMLHFKTKPCKFYKTNQVCPNGDLCTFIHDEPEGRPVSAQASNVEDTIKSQPELPSKPVSVREENTKKGFFPISWRVIGGGVLLSGPRGRSHPEPAQVTGTPTTPMFASKFDMPEASTCAQVGEQQESVTSNVARSSLSITVDIPTPHSEDSLTPTKVNSRARANSIPTTPTINHVDVLTLFSAESPGGL